MFTNRFQIVLLLITLFLSSGCVYPIYKTLQPEATIYIVDEKEQAIDDAKVFLFSNTIFAPNETNVTQQTDTKGFAHFDRVSKWKLESLVIHGQERYFWNWCIEKEGFETKFTYGYTGFQEKSKFMLRKGMHSTCVSPKKGLFYPPIVKDYDFATRYKNGEMYNKVRGLITEMLNPKTAKKAYSKLQKLPTEYLPYIIMNMNDKRAVSLQLLSFEKDEEHVFESIPHYEVRRVIDVLDLLTKYILKRKMPKPENTHYHNGMYNYLLKGWRVWLYLH